MATCTVSRNLFGLVITAAPGHPAIARIRRLPRDLWIGPVPGSTDHEWLVALAPPILPTARAIFRMNDVTFTPEAIATLQQLRDSPSRGLSSPVRDASRSKGAEVHPDVCAPLRSLPPTLDPFLSADSGGESPGATAAPTSDGDTL